jgi:hypothetical protein
MESVRLQFEAGFMGDEEEIRAPSGCSAYAPAPGRAAVQQNEDGCINWPADLNPETGKPWETMTEAELIAGLACVSRITPRAPPEVRFGS